MEVGGTSIVVIVTTAVEGERRGHRTPEMDAYEADRRRPGRPRTNLPQGHGISPSRDRRDERGYRDRYRSRDRDFDRPRVRDPDRREDERERTALRGDPVEVVMSLIMVVVLSATLAVWPAVTADADVTVILKCGHSRCKRYRRDSQERGAARVEPPTGAVCHSGRRENEDARRRTRRPFLWQRGRRD